MASLNVNTKNVRTHEGAPAFKVSPADELGRLVLNCFLWENNFYQTGNAIANRMAELVKILPKEKIETVAFWAREDMNLRHVPLFLVCELAKNKKLSSETCARLIQRPDEATELIAIWWRNGKISLPNQMKKGIAKALTKFSEYQLAKYQNKGDIKLVDVFNIVHAKPKDKAQEKTWKKLMNGGLEAPETWEVLLSAGNDKKETWEKLLMEGKLGGLAFLRNLRNMLQCGLDKKTISQFIDTINFQKVLPFRFIAAAKHAPPLEDVLEKAMLASATAMPKLKGSTILLVDVSASMHSPLSGKSDMTALEAANALAILLREICEAVSIYTFSSKVMAIPPRRGFALRDVIVNSQPNANTYLGNALTQIQHIDRENDRIIVFTDEQSADPVPRPIYKNNYMINVASNSHTITNPNNWVTLSGFSERIVDFIQMLEGGTNEKN